MTVNPYAPPAADVGDITQHEVAPTLWNPNAAANWSLLLSPAFGAFLHMKNWQALGEPAKAASAKVWAILSLVVLIGGSTVSALLPNIRAADGLSRILLFCLLITWYFVSARAQARYVQERFGKSYPRKGWGKPLLVALLVFAGFVAAFVVVGLVGAVLTRV